MEEHAVFTAQAADALEAEEILFSFIFPGHFLRKSRCPYGYRRTCVCNAETPKHFAYFDVSETLDFSGINAAFHNVHHLHHSNGISQWHTRYDPRRPATGLRRRQRFSLHNDSVWWIQFHMGDDHRLHAIWCRGAYQMKLLRLHSDSPTSEPYILP